MSSSVDERIVAMKMDNKSLLSGVKSSQAALSNLNKTVQAAASSKGMQGLGSSVDEVKHKFSLLNAAAITAVATVTNKLVNAGINMVKSFTLDPIIAGFHSYETTINATKTIMSNTGASAKTTGKYLKDLQVYANQTVYNFADMAKNIGTFTAAGVKLAPATEAIKGIANLAAVSGSTAEQASSAMYQLSQALASGKVGLQDWNSVVNAGMGGKIFQTALARTAANMGTLDKSTVKFTKDGKLASIAGSSFRESIQAKPGETPWLTSKVLAETLGQFSMEVDTAKHRQEAFKKLIDQGYSPKAAKDIIKLANVAAHSATDIKTFTQLREALGEEVATAWGNVFTTIFGGIKETTKFWSAIHIAAENALTAPVNALNTILKMWSKMGGRSALIQGLVNIWTALGDVFKAVGMAWHEAFPDSGKGAATVLTSLSKGFESLTKSLIPSKAQIKDLAKVFKVVFQVLGIGVNIISNIYGYFLDLFMLIVGNSGGAVKGIMGIVGGVANLISKFLEWVNIGPKITAFFKSMEANRAKLLAPIIKTISGIVQAIGRLFRTGDLSKFWDTFKNAFTNLLPLGDIISGWGDKIAHLGDFLMNAIKNLAAKSGLAGLIGRTIISALDSVKGFGQKVEAWFGGIFGNIDLGKYMDKVLGSITSAWAKLKGQSTGAGVLGWMKDELSGIGDAIKNVVGSITGLFHSFSGGGAKAAHGTMLELASATTTVSDGGSKMADIFKVVWGIIKQGASNVASSVKGLVGGIQSVWDAISGHMGGVNKGDLINTIGLIFDGAILLQIRKYIKGFQGFVNTFSDFGEKAGGVFDQLTGNLKTMQSGVKAKMILEIATAVGILAASIWVISKIPTKQLAISLGAVGIMMGELVGSLALLSKTGAGMSLPVVAASLVLMSTSLVVLAGAIALFGKMNTGTLVKGFIAMGAAIAVLVVAANGLSGVAPQMALAAVGLTVLSVALSMMVGTILLYDKLNWGTLIGGLLKMAVAMVALGAAGVVLGAGGPAMLVGAAAMGVLAVTLTMMLGTILAFSQVSWGTLGKGIAMIAVALVAIGVAALVAAPGVIALGAGVLVLGTGLMLAGVGMGLFAAGFATLAATGAAASAVIVAGIHAFLALLPVMAVQLGVAFKAFMDTMAHLAPQISNDFVKIIGSLISAAQRILPKLTPLASNAIHDFLKVVRQNAPDFGRTLQVMINTGLKVLQNSIPRMVKTGMNILDGILTGIHNHLPHIMTEATNIVVDFINGIGNHMDRVITAGTNTVIKFIQGLGKNGVRLANAAGKTILDFINGLDAAVNKYQGRINDAGWNLAEDIVQGIINGLASKVGDVASAAGNLASSALGSMRHIFDSHSPSRETHAIGVWAGIGLANGMEASRKHVTKAAQHTASHAVSVFAATAKMFNGIGLDLGTSMIKGLVESLKGISAAGKIMAKYTDDTISKTAMMQQQKADALRAKAAAYHDAAALTRRRLHNKKLSKEQRKQISAEAKRLDVQGRQAGKQASGIQKGIDAAARKAAWQKRFDAADEQGKSDMLNQRAKAAASAAEKDRQKAIELAKEADLVRSKDAKKAAALEKQARKAMHAAEQAAKAAQNNADQANIHAGNAALGTIADTQKQLDADKEAKRVAAMSDADKAAYYKAEQEKQQKISDDKYAEAQTLLDQAKAEADTNAAQAAKDAAKAQKALEAAEAAQQAADQAAQDAQSAADAAGQASSDIASSNQDLINALQMPAIDIASSQVYGAQNMFDAYAKALAATTSAATKDAAPTVQFIQNNTSPVALSPSEVYRQTNNLMSNVERKLAGALS